MPKVNITKLSKWAAGLDPAQFFLVVALPLGILLCVLTPPFMVADEQAHFFRAYQISEGGFTPQRIDNGIGGHLPKSLVDSSIVLIGKLPGEPGEKASKQLIWDELSRPHKASDRTDIHFENTALYSPLAYAPTSLGIGIARVFDVSPVAMLYVGRLFTVLAWVGITFMAIRLIPIARWAFMVIAVAPMALFQAASVSADGLTIGLCFLTVAWFVRLCMQSRAVTKKQWAFTLGVVVAIGCMKQPYALLGLLYLALPAKQVVGQVVRWQWYASIIAALVATAGSWYLISKSFFMQSPFLLDRVLQPDQQLAFILEHPWRFIKAVVLTHTTSSGDGNINELVGVFGWLDAPLPLWTVLVYVAVVVVAIGLAYKDRVLPRFQRLVMVGLAAAAFLAIDVLLYLYWNAVGLGLIMGVQGRYYLMLLPLIIVAAAGLYAISFKKVSHQFVIVCGLATVWLVMLLTIVNRFYI